MTEDVGNELCASGTSCCRGGDDGGGGVSDEMMIDSEVARCFPLERDGLASDSEVESESELRFIMSREESGWRFGFLSSGLDLNFFFRSTSSSTLFSFFRLLLKDGRAPRYTA